MTIHHSSLDKQYFEMAKSGLKIYEFRVYIDKYKDTTNDIWIFECNPNQFVKTKIIDSIVFKTYLDVHSFIKQLKNDEDNLMLNKISDDMKKIYIGDLFNKSFILFELELYNKN